MAIIPAYNESPRVARVLKAVRAYLPVLLVDDGSTDDTAVIAEDAGATVLRQIPNQGKGAALKAGYQRALDQDYQAVLTLDADGQHDPGEIPIFLDKYQSGSADLIIGERDFSQMPASRRLANWLGKVTFSWAMGQDIPDNQSGYRLVSRRLMQALLESDESGFEFEVEMIRTCVRRGYGLDWVPISTIYAGESSHIDPIKHIIEFLRMVWQTRWSR
ncbi:MAG: glycosyltransferase family 2 protein [Anaerolineales bacterium]